MTGRRCVIIVAAVAVVVAVTAIAFWRPWAAHGTSGAGARPPAASEESSGASASPSTRLMNGVAYELPWVADTNDAMAVALEFLKAHTATGFKWSNGTDTFEVADTVFLNSPRNNEITLNGKKYGRVKSGDHVQLAPNGVLYINGIERKPE